MVCDGLELSCYGVLFYHLKVYYVDNLLTRVFRDLAAAEGGRAPDNHQKTKKKLKSDTLMSRSTLFKLLIVGESGVGKTCILLQFADGRFENSHLSTIGVDFKVKEMVVDDKPVKLQIWDSAGQERFRNITASYYRNCSGILIVYDVTDHESFDRVSKWIEEVRAYVPTVPLIILGNKADLESERAVTVEEGKELAERHKLVCVETSAKESTNIESTFVEFARQLIKDQESRPKPEVTSQVNVGTVQPQRGMCC